MTAVLSAIYRYPVKGLSGESLSAVRLEPGACLPHDRQFAIAHGSTRFEGGDAHWLPKQNFLMLAKDERLAQLRVRYEAEEGRLTVLRDGKPVVTAKPGETMGRMLIGQFFAGFMAAAARGAPKLVAAPGTSFSDVPEKVVSLINLASVSDLERVARQAVDPLRFRGNLYLADLPAWCEFDWVGRELEIGGARLQVIEPIERCAATNVNPETAERDMNLPLTLRKGFGHMDMGVYAKVVAGGQIAPGDRVTLSSP